MNEVAKLFYDIGEPFAAGLFEETERGYFYRYSLAYARYFEHLSPAKYDGESLYPCGNKFFSDCAMAPCFARTYKLDLEKMSRKSEKAREIIEKFCAESACPKLWIHSTPNYKRIIREGLDSYRERVKKQADDNFREGLLALLDGLKSYIDRSVNYLREVGAPAELVDALEKVPFSPADTYYEGLVAWNILAYFDGMDNLGCLDDGLIHLYKGEDMTGVIERLFDNINEVGHWSCTIGPNYNEVTIQALRAVGGRRRPMLELMVTDDMPDELWKIAIENVRTGCGNPSFYNIRKIQKMLKDHFPRMTEEELDVFCGCGCTETTLQGMTRAGGTDGDVQLTTIFREYMLEQLPKADTFDEFYEGFCAAAENEINKHIDMVCGWYMYLSKYLPSPIRTLFTDDCIDKGKDFNAGGARYTWTMSSESGLINVIDSLLAVRELVFRKKQFTANEFLTLLDREDDSFFMLLKTCPCFGRDDNDADELAVDLAGRLFSVFRSRPPYEFIDAFTLTEHQFSRYGYVAENLGPTPDGRRFGDPTCDSVAAIRGKAIYGPTAMLKSAAKLPQHLVDGITVINLTIQKSFSEKVLRSLVESYFKLGGMQVQITCTDVKDLLDAVEHPEKHEDLIVRVGGYSEYFNNLTDALKQAVIDRNFHEV